MTAPLYAIHPLAELIPSMLMDEVADLERDIRANGQRQPIVLYDGKILDGRHRYAVCQKLGITPTFTRFEGDEAAARAVVLSLNVHRRHLSFEQKQQIVECELKRDPTQSDRAIGEKAKVSHPTVAKARAKLVNAGQLETVTSSTGRDGKVRTRKPKAQATGDVSTVDTIVGKDGVKQPAKKATLSPDTAPAAAKPDAPPSSPSTASASWARRAGPVAIAQEIFDALADADRALSVGRQLQKLARKALREEWHPPETRALAPPDVETVPASIAGGEA